MREGRHRMPLGDLLVMRRTLKAVQRGLPVQKSLELIEWALDHCDDDTLMLEHLLRYALEEDQVALRRYCEGRP
jgi:hypothetical protein